MFEKETKALQAHNANATATILIVAPAIETAIALGGRFNKPFSAVSYDSLYTIRGSSFVGAVLLDPPEEKALVPRNVLLCLATTAMLTDQQPYKLVKVYRKGRESDETLYDGSKWWCRECTCLRDKAPCWKCGTSVGHFPIAGTVDLQMPDINQMRAIVGPLGWVLSVHGSMERDLDVIATAWCDEAVSIDAMVGALMHGLKNDNGSPTLFGPELKPHGRIAYNIQINGFYKLIDLSIANGGHIK